MDNKSRSTTRGDELNNIKFNLMTSGERLGFILKEEKCTQAKLAGKLGITVQHLSCIIHGKKPLTNKLAARIINVFPSWRVEFLLCKDDCPTNMLYTLLQLALQAGEDTESRTLHNDERLFQKSIESLITVFECLGYQINQEATSDSNHCAVVTVPSGDVIHLPYSDFIEDLQVIIDLCEFRLTQELKRKGRIYSDGEHSSTT